ncbi:hypothetical protein Tco_1061820 [Tanacetum coccineum]
MPELIKFVRKILAELESEEVINSPCFCGEEFAIHEQTVHALTSQKQTVFGKDKSIPLMVDSLPKTVWKDVAELLEKNKFAAKKD